MIMRQFMLSFLRNVGLIDLKYLFRDEIYKIKLDIDENTDYADFYFRYVKPKFLTNGIDEKRISYVLKELIAEYQKEENRKDRIESKAVGLFSWVALVLTLSITGAGLIREHLSLRVLGAATILSLLLGLVFALKATRVSTYKFHEPKLNMLWDEITIKELEITKSRDILYAILMNKKLINLKATLTDNAQLWVRNALFLIAILAISILWSGESSNNALPPLSTAVTQTPTPISTVTPVNTTLPPSVTPSILPSPIATSQSTLIVTISPSNTISPLITP